MRNPRTKYKRSKNVFSVTSIALIIGRYWPRLVQPLAQSLIGSPGTLGRGGACTKPVTLGQTTGTSTACPSGTSRLGQVVLVPVGQAGCLYQTCPTGTMKGQKRPLLVPWDKSYTHAGGLSLSRDELYV